MDTTPSHSQIQTQRCCDMIDGGRSSRGSSHCGECRIHERLRSGRHECTSRVLSPLSPKGEESANAAATLERHTTERNTLEYALLHARRSRKIYDVNTVNFIISLCSYNLRLLCACELVSRRMMGICTQSRTSGMLMILPQVHLWKPCYDFYFL